MSERIPNPVDPWKRGSFPSRTTPEGKKVISDIIEKIQLKAKLYKKIKVPTVPIVHKWLDQVQNSISSRQSQLKRLAVKPRQSLGGIHMADAPNVDQLNLSAEPYIIPFESANEEEQLVSYLDVVQDGVPPPVVFAAPATTKRGFTNAHEQRTTLELAKYAHARLSNMIREGVDKRPEDIGHIAMAVYKAEQGHFARK